MITVIGTGFGSAENITLSAWKELQSAKKVILKTEKMPLAPFLKENNIPFTTLDHLYESSADFDELNGKIKETLNNSADCVYAVQGSATDDTSVKLLVGAHIIAGVSLCDSASASCAFFGSRRDVTADDVICGYRPSCRENTVVYCIDSKFIACDVKCILTDIYGDECKIKVYYEDFNGNPFTRDILLYELDMLEEYNHTFCVLLPAQELTAPCKHGINEVLEVTNKLYSPDGCPWDREQTHESLRRFLIEEAYEVAETVDNGDFYSLFDELGDVLYQVTLHSAIAKEAGEFDFSDVCDAISKKMIRRHPTLFGKEDVSWDEIKMQEKGQETASEVLDSIPKSLPALLYAEKLQYKCEKSGIKHEIGQKNIDISENNAGKILFEAVNACREKGISPELALRTYCNSFLEKAKEKLAKNS